jgi:hypothetical protein
MRSVHRLDVTADDGTIRIALHGDLDADAGALLLSSATSAAQGGARRLEVDVSAVTAFTSEGLEALVACRGAAVDVVEGLHYRAGATLGFDVLLAALTPARA